MPFESKRSERHELAKMQITQSRMPLDARDKVSVVTWLRQMADEIERGEHWDSAIFTLGPHRT